MHENEANLFTSAPSGCRTLVWDQEVAGPNPVAPTQETSGLVDGGEPTTDAPDSKPDSISGPALLVGGGHRPIIPCFVCGKPVFHARFRSDRSDRHVCSNRCAGTLAARAIHASFITPESTKAERVRANGLVNKRLKLGWFTKPKTCSMCGKGGCRIMSHHRDYKKPDHVHWVCHGCHIRVHRKDSLLDGFPPFVCEKKPGFIEKPRHRKGGRRVPDEQKKPRARWSGIVRHEVDAGDVIEILACCHTYRRPEDGKRHKQRRCIPCRDGIENVTGKYAASPASLARFLDAAMPGKDGAK